MFLNESRARVAERCLRQFYWFHLHGGHGLRSIRSDDKLIWGSLLHAGLAGFYSDEPVGQALRNELQAVFPTWDDLPADEKNKWLEELEWIQKVVGRYGQWAATQDSFTVLGVEQVGSVELGDSPHRFVFRLDLLVRTNEGIEVIDHKSTSSGVDERYLASWEHSSQLWGYSYGAAKQMGYPISRYGVNIIRRVNSAGEEPDLTKCCPACKNGSKKRLNCGDCKGSGRVGRALRPADRPFHRETFSFTKAKEAWFIESRTKIADKIEQHQTRLADGDLSAFPRNPSQCYKCPLTDVCYQPNLADWRTAWIPEERFLTKGPDYVTMKQMAVEEAL